MAQEAFMSEAFDESGAARTAGTPTANVIHNITGIRLPRLLTGLHDSWRGMPKGPLRPEQEAELHEAEASIRAIADGGSLTIDRLAGRNIGPVRFRRLGEALFVDSEAYETAAGKYAEGESLMQRIIRETWEFDRGLSGMRLEMRLPRFFEPDSWMAQGGSFHSVMTPDSKFSPTEAAEAVQHYFGARKAPMDQVSALAGPAEVQVRLSEDMFRQHVAPRLEVRRQR